MWLRRQRTYLYVFQSKTCISSPSRNASSLRKMLLHVPHGAWDSHMHVTDPVRFPISKAAVYQPHQATLEQARSNAQRLHLPNLVFVQPSTYGYDNACLLDGLKQTTPGHGRGVVSFDPDAMEPETLQQWHELGVRGVRINLKSINSDMSAEALTKLLKHYDRVIAPMKTWAIQLYVDLTVVQQLKSAMKELKAKVVIDHLGSPNEIKQDMSAVPGWDDLNHLLEHNENFFVKISAPYRLTEDETYHSLEPAVKGLLESAKRGRGGAGVVFASDWPHTRFESADVQPFVQRCLEWCGDDEELARKLFRTNAETLWDV